MAAFEYTALDARGKESRGVIEGDAPRQVRQQLRDKGLIPLSVEEVSRREKRRRGGALQLRRGVSATELALFTRQLATLAQSGLPLEEALQTVARQSEGSRLQSMVLAVRAKVLEGHTLAAGLGEFPYVFPDLYRSTVAAGEQSGHLDGVLDRLADYTERRQQMRQKIGLALFYPIILMVVAVLIVIGLLTYVVPKVVTVFENMDQELPALTRGLIGLSDFLRVHWWWLLLLVVAAAFAVRALLKVSRVRHRWHELMLRLPIIGRLVRGANSARFARTLSILVGSGVPVLEAMRISAEVLGSLPMRESVSAAADRVREGAGIAPALERSGYFPPMLVHLIASGESSGRLEEMLERAAANQERELETQIAALMGVFEPLMILMMGLVVLLIVLAILLPIFEMNNLVQ